MRAGLDWALIELEHDLEVCTLAPYPTRLADPTVSDNVDEYREVYVKPPRSLLSGRLLPSLYYIRPEGEDRFMEVWTLELNDHIRKLTLAHIWPYVWYCCC